MQRTVLFGLLAQSIAIIWCHLAGHHPTVVGDRLHRAPWYPTKTCPSYADMIAEPRRVLIAAQHLPEVPCRPTPDEIRAMHLARALAAA